VKIRIALAQAESEVGNVAANVSAALDLIAKAGQAKADVVLFCELFLQGCPVEADFVHTAVATGDDVMRKLSDAARANDVSVVIGTARREDQFPHNVYNSAAVFSPSGFLGFYDKLQVANYATYNEALSFARGGALPRTFDLPFGRIGVSICYDIMFPEVSLSLALNGAVLQLVPSAGGAEFESDWDALLVVRSKENQVFLAYCNAVGAQGSDVFVGRSRVVGPDGRMRGPASGRVAALTFVDVDLDDVRTERHRRPIFRDRPTLAAAQGAFAGGASPARP
jgi:predicted amidohydrolase